MGFSTYQIFLASLMLVTGALNTLSAKFADRQTAKCRDGIERPFSHPFLQATCMFLGESLCFLIFQIIYQINKRRTHTPITDNGNFNMNALVSGNQQFNPFVFLPAALCDMVGTIMAYIGFNLSYSSSFQMLRGAVIVCSGLLSSVLLGRQFQKFKWFGMFMVVVGLSIIGITDFIYSNDAKIDDMVYIIIADLLIIMTQSATQTVYEEKFVTMYNVPPLQVVGWEGIFGFFTLSTLLIPMYFIKVPSLNKYDPNHRLENTIDALYQIKNNPVILTCTLLNVFSIAFFNFAGISITRELSATTRMILDSSRTVVIWFCTLFLKWHSFQVLQLLGFAFLIIGICVYNNLIFISLCQRLTSRNEVVLISNVNENVANETTPLLRPPIVLKDTNGHLINI